MSEKAQDIIWSPEARIQIRSSSKSALLVNQYLASLWGSVFAIARSQFGVSLHGMRGRGQSCKLQFISGSGSCPFLTLLLSMTFLLRSSISRAKATISDAVPQRDLAFDLTKGKVF
jgi:hypothetical protein